MRKSIIKLKIVSPFVSTMKGDTLFGQICWVIVNRYGEKRLEELLEGYNSGNPFLVVSDAFPESFLPRPSLPLHLFKPVENFDRKEIKKRVWIPGTFIKRPVVDWLENCVSESMIMEAGSLWKSHVITHNTINRLTGTTGKDGFAPFSQMMLWPGGELILDIHLVFDENRISKFEIEELFEYIGVQGFGAESSTGAGKFIVKEMNDIDIQISGHENIWMTLAPCVIQGLGLDASGTWYKTFVRFGRHGDKAALSGKPFKSPVILADTGALLTNSNNDYNKLFTGRGLGGNGEISDVIPETVYQGYAPVVSLQSGL